MLSSRGAITTNVAMVECASGQNPRGKEVFLLSELEKVWVAVCILVRRHLLDGQDAQIPNFGSFWREERCLIHDTTHYRQRFSIHHIKFGVNANFSRRYGMDSVKAPLEKQNLSYAKIHMADVVSVCAVPAHTAAMALKEFVMYLGEGLHCGRTFQLDFPGVATLVIKKERFMLTLDAELQSELYELDSRKWPSEIQALGREKMEEERAPGSAVSSRPGSSSRVPRFSRPPTAASSSAGTAASSAVSAPRPVFNPAAPKDRLFEDIAKETARRREAEQLRRQADLAEARRQERVDRLIHSYDCYTVGGEEDEEEEGDRGEVAPRGGGDVDRTFTLRPATRESVYEWVAEDRIEPAPAPAEPEVEVIEVTEEESAEGATAGTANGAMSGPHGKDPMLESILKQEETFSRPISRRRDCMGHSSVRELIYGTNASMQSNGQATSRTRRRDPAVDSITISPQHADPVAAAGASVVPPQFGRKRHAEYYGTNDSVGALLKDPNEK